jgi:hypothetical protein
LLRWKNRAAAEVIEQGGTTATSQLNSPLRKAVVWLLVIFTLLLATIVVEFLSH